MKVQDIEKKMTAIKTKIEEIKNDLIADIEQFEAFDEANYTEEVRAHMQDDLEELENQMDLLTDQRIKTSKNLERLQKIKQLPKNE